MLPSQVCCCMQALPPCAEPTVLVVDSIGGDDDIPQVRPHSCRVQWRCRLLVFWC
jgi:hypothetical protein